MMKRISWPVLALGGLLFFLIVCPLAELAIQALYVDGSWELSYAAATLAEPQNAQMIGNSLRLGVLVVLTATVISLPLAYLLSRTSWAGSSALELLFFVPFMTPPYIAAMGWILFMQKNGLLAQLVPSLSEGVPPFFSLAGLVLVMSLHIFPFLTLFLKNAMLEIPASLEEAAAIAGAGPWLRLRRIFLPLLTGNYAIGALLVFVKTLSEYGTPYTLGRRIGYDVFTTDIHRYASIAPISFGKAAVLSSVLVLICLLFWLVQSEITRRKSYHLIGGRGARHAFPRLRGWKRAAGIAYLAAAFTASVFVPISAVFFTSIIRLRGYGLQWGNFTLAHYQELLLDDTRALDALGSSLVLAIFAAAICAVLGTLVVLAVRRSGRWGKGLEGCSLLPEMLPGIVLVIGLMLFWNDIYDVLPLYHSFGILLLTYVVLFLPFTVQYVTSSFTQIQESLLSAGRVFGGTPRYVFFHITLPLIRRGVLAGAMMTFIISLRELVAPSLIAPPNTLVISTYIVREFEQGSVSAGMAMAMLCLGLTWGMMVLLRRSLQRWQGPGRW